MQIQWLGQSGYILKDEETTICIDPYLSNIVEKKAGKARLFPAPVRAQDIMANAVICSHNHLDHLDPDTIPLLRCSKTTFYAPLDCRKTMLELDVERYVPFEEGNEIKIGKFKIKAVPAVHTVPAIGLMVAYNEIRMYFSGDTFYDEKLEELKTKKIDYMFICINGKLGNMNAEEAVHLTKIIAPRVAIPNHYGMFAENTENPALFTAKIENSFIMEPGKIYEVSECLI